MSNLNGLMKFTFATYACNRLFNFNVSGSWKYHSKNFNNCKIFENSLDYHRAEPRPYGFSMTVFTLSIVIQKQFLRDQQFKTKMSVF